MKSVLVLGATGYVGGRLVPELLSQGFKVYAASRSLKKLHSRPWASHPNVVLVEVDVFNIESLNKAVQNCQAVYYLIHSMEQGQSDFSEADRKAANNMVQVAESNQIQQIIYLGGLGDDEKDLSKHLQSRHEVEHILRSGQTPVTALRAAMIIGSGSASFEILRYLVDRLPIMITPKWVHTKSQPIAIRNVIHYLTGCLLLKECLGKTFDIGGPDIISYQELMKIYQEEAGLLPRIILRVPVLTPRLSSYWIHLITPIPAGLAKPLVEGLRNEVICHNNDIQKWVTQPLLGCREAIALALNKLRHNQVASHWSDSGKMPPYEWTYEGDPEWSGGTCFEDSQCFMVHAPRERVWEIISQIGGNNGWYYANCLWKIRGFIDHMIGGVGLRRGRKSQLQLHVGDALDFWRVLSVEQGEQLLLAAEMKVPGKATLEFKLKRIAPNQTELRQVARFKPSGLWGILYWYTLLPLHNYIFRGMPRSIMRRAELEIREVTEDNRAGSTQ